LEPGLAATTGTRCCPIVVIEVIPIAKTPEGYAKGRETAGNALEFMDFVGSEP
jgi:hypothetical protein